MLKKLVIFTLFFGLISINHADDHRPAPSAAEGHNPANPTAPTAAEKRGGPELQQNRPPEQPGAEPKSVRITLPPKDNYDIWTFRINAMLALVGFAGIGIGICTLLLIRRQTNGIEAQAVQMALQLEQMESQTRVANSTLIAQFRPSTTTA